MYSLQFHGCSIRFKLLTLMFDWFMCQITTILHTLLNLKNLSFFSSILTVYFCWNNIQVWDVRCCYWIFCSKFYLYKFIEMCSANVNYRITSQPFLLKKSGFIRFGLIIESCNVNNYSYLYTWLFVILLVLLLF